ncbi:Uncharacterized protein GBIM_16664 [Gryllus bimaculatus]|nr:Uncharacterized protein GBIM_16664 [Gryllus bimaculatus]
MFKRRATRNLLFDRLHKGVVISCLALTLYGSFMIGDKMYRYFTVLRPQLKAKQEEEQKKLLSEGKASPDVSVMVDPASNLKA